VWNAVVVAEKRRRYLAALLLLSALVGLIPAAGPVSADEPIQPGARMLRPHGCTLNFVFQGAADRTLYIGTAGHCTDVVGQRVSTAAGEIGTVAFRVLEGTDDFAIIEIDERLHALVSPKVRGLGGPTGSTTAAGTTAGDRVMLYGHGMVYGSFEATRARSGLLTKDDAFEWFAALPAIFGDSGGPVLHGPSGAALGVISGVSADQTRPHTVMGTTIERALELLAEAGLPVELKLATPDAAGGAE